MATKIIDKYILTGDKDMENGKRKSKILIIAAIIVIVCLTVILVIALGKNNETKGTGSNLKSSNSIKIEDYKEKIENIKYKSNNGIVYENDEIRIATYRPDDENTDEEKDKVFGYVSVRDDVIPLKSLYVYNKTSESIRFEIEEITISDYKLSNPSSESIDKGANEMISMPDISMASDFINAMGLGALNNIKIEVSINNYKSSSHNEIINIKTDCKEKAKKFDLPEKKLFNKNGIKIYLAEKYINDNKTFEEIKEKSEYKEFYNNRLLQPSATAWIYCVNENSTEKKITVRVECDNKMAKEKYFGVNFSDMENAKNKEINIQGNCVSQEVISPDYTFDGLVEKEYQYDPHSVKYIINIDGEDVCSIDFEDAQVK